MNQKKRDKTKKQNIRIQKKLYNAKRYEEKKDDIKLKSAIYYKNRETDDPYRKIKLDKQNERNRIKRIGKEPAKMGRPKKDKTTEEPEPKEKKPLGRPRLYF